MLFHAFNCIDIPPFSSRHLNLDACEIDLMLKGIYIHIARYIIGMRSNEVCCARV